MNIEDNKKLDTLLATELQISSISRCLGYDPLGDPIELVFNLKNQNYEWHLGGEYLKDASDPAALAALQRLPQSSQ